jgi:hypothetical protein
MEANTKVTEARRATKVDTSESLRICEQILQAAENRLDWAAYHAAVKRGSAQPWLYL